MEMLNCWMVHLDKPNGICFSPDEKKLYVNDSPEGEIYVWDVSEDSTIVNKRIFQNWHTEDMPTE